MSFRMGCAVWSYKGWVGSLFPARSKSSDFLQLYGQRFQNVEGNTTFYAIPSPETVLKWRDDTPESFRFCLKIPQQISHQDALDRNIEATHAFLARMAPLGPRLGPLFLQLPPGFGLRRIEELERWLAAWPTQYQVSVEVRHPDWYTTSGETQLIELLHRYQVGHCLMDVRPLDLGDLPGAEVDMQRARDHKPQVPMRPWVTGNMVLVRYISHPDQARNQALWVEWAQRIAEWLQQGVQVDFFMHCPVEQQSPDNARVFYRQLQRLVSLPDLPWEAHQTPEQGQLF